MMRKSEHEAHHSSPTAHHITVDGFRTSYAWDSPYAPPVEVLIRESLSLESTEELARNPITGSKTQPAESHVSIGGTAPIRLEILYIMLFTMAGAFASYALFTRISAPPESLILLATPGAACGALLGLWFSRWRSQRASDRARRYLEFRTQYAQDVIETADPVTARVLEVIDVARQNAQAIDRAGAGDLAEKMPPVSCLAGQVISAHLAALRPVSTVVIAQARDLLTGTNPTDDSQAVADMRAQLKAAETEAQPLNERAEALLSELSAAGARTSELARSARARAQVTGEGQA